MDKYMVLDERRNAIDFLTQSLTFLSMVEQNRFYLKWFIIAFHGAVYSFMLLVLQGVNQDQIYRKKPKHAQGPVKEGELDLFDGFLIDILKAYEYLQKAEHTNGQPYTQTGIQETCMKELNYKLRNQMMHFKPMLSAYEPWYPAEVCTPLLNILRYCVRFERNYLSNPERETMLSTIDAIETLLTKHKKDGDYLDRE